MQSHELQDNGTQELLIGLKSFSLPGGEEATRSVRRVRLTEEGEMRSAPGACWIPFTAEEVIDVRRSGFVWEACLRAAKLVPMSVTDAYENGHGRLVVKVAGALPLVNARGPDFDRGELQRYLSGVIWCPPILVAHPTLEWRAIGAQTLRVRDKEDPTGATVDIDLGDGGCPLGCRADRPRMVGKRTELTPWTGRAMNFQEIGGLRIPKRVEAAWLLTEGEFIYFRADVTSMKTEC